jgi:hypothetical protein
MRIWSDFRIGADGYGRMLVAANGLDGGDLTRAVQRLQELGSYRNLALLGLPVARAAWPRLDEAEADLRRLGEALTRNDVRDDDLMAQLSALSLAIAAVASATDYRMSATAAYALLVEERLADLAPQPIPFAGRIHPAAVPAGGPHLRGLFQARTAGGGPRRAVHRLLRASKHASKTRTAPCSPRWNAAPRGNCACNTWSRGFR